MLYICYVTLDTILIIHTYVVAVLVSQVSQLVITSVCQIKSTKCYVAIDIYE